MKLNPIIKKRIQRHAINAAKDLLQVSEYLERGDKARSTYNLRQTVKKLLKLLKDYKNL